MIRNAKRLLKMNEAGDTLVEVMLSAAVLSLVLAGAFTISNRATRINQNANERTQASNLMQREVELLRATSISDVDAFWAIVDTYTVVGENNNFCNTEFDTINPRSSPTLPTSKGAFYMDTSSGSITIQPLGVSPGTISDNDTTDLLNIWIEAVDEPVTATYTDFFVYSCWLGSGDQGMQRTGLVVRLAR